MRTMIIAIVSLVVFLVSKEAARADIITFEDLALSPQSFNNGEFLPGSFTSGGAVFNNNYNAAFAVWSGWSYSNVVDPSTPGFLNQYASFPGGGDSSSKYGVAFAFSPGDATITLSPGTRPDSIRIANTTYAALSMMTGDAFAKKFGGASGNDPDFFLLTITGKNALDQSTGTIDFYLADFRFSNNSQDYIASDWRTVDLSGLGADTTMLSFGLSSSDVGSFGMNTPAFFAADNLSVAAVPEPSSVILLVLTGLMVCVVKWRKRRVVASAA